MRTAVTMVEWTAESKDNMKIYTDFANTLLRRFERCLVARRSMKMEKEFMWREYRTFKDISILQKGLGKISTMHNW